MPSAAKRRALQTLERPPLLQAKDPWLHETSRTTADPAAELLRVSFRQFRYKLQKHRQRAVSQD